jgi:hypothetical protein
VAGLIVTVAKEWSALKRLAMAGAGLVLALLPWRLWMAANDITSDLPLEKGLNPSFLIDRADRVWPSMTAFEQQLVDVGRWSYIVPIAIAVIAVCLVSSLRSELPSNTGRVALFYLGTGIGFFLVITWAYTITSDPLAWQIQTASSRVITGIVLISVAAIVHLSGMLGGGAVPSDGATRESSLD